jgi:glycosyltransferase involved in cell wall biosynthesis
MYNLNAWKAVQRIGREERIDIVDAPVSFGDAFLCSIWKPGPLVLQTFAFSRMFLSTRSYSGLGEMILFAISSVLEGVSLRRADRIIANSPATYRFLSESRFVPTGRVSLVWESRIDLKTFRFVPSDIRERLGIAPHVPLILCVGWLQPRKGPHVLLEALPQVLRAFSNAVAVFVGRDTLTGPGGGSFRDFLLARAGEQGLAGNVKIIDELLPEAELVRLYSACDVFVLPSLSETFGWPVAEAMACGRPVVATATGIAPDLKRNGAGFVLVSPGDIEAIANGVIGLLAMPKAERDRLGSAHRAIVEEIFDLDRAVHEILSLYQRVIAEQA